MDPWTSKGKHRYCCAGICQIAFYVLPVYCDVSWSVVIAVLMIVVVVMVLMMMH